MIWNIVGNLWRHPLTCLPPLPDALHGMKITPYLLCVFLPSLTWKWLKQSIPQWEKGSAACTLSSGRAAIFWIWVTLQRHLHTVHLNRNKNTCRSTTYDPKPFIPEMVYSHAHNLDVQFVHAIVWSLAWSHDSLLEVSKDTLLLLIVIKCFGFLPKPTVLNWTFSYSKWTFFFVFRYVIFPKPRACQQNTCLVLQQRLHAFLYVKIQTAIILFGG